MHGPICFCTESPAAPARHLDHLNVRPVGSGLLGCRAGAGWRPAGSCRTLAAGRALPDAVAPPFPHERRLCLPPPTAHAEAAVDLGT